VLASVTITEPRIPVYSNVTGAPFGGASDVAALLPRQLVEPVQWEGSVRRMLADGEC
jgi:[acyl-carrier-protein] S-malonyltransferase